MGTESYSIRHVSVGLPNVHRRFRLVLNDPGDCQRNVIDVNDLPPELVEQIAPGARGTGDRGRR